MRFVPPSRPLAACLLALFCAGEKADGSPRLPYNDDTVVARSDLIVFGHLLTETIRYVDHDRPAGEGASWEHHATLAVTEVLKGRCESKEIPVVVEYGLDPLVRTPRATPIGITYGYENFSKGRPGGWDRGVQVCETGAGMGATVLLEDAGQDNLWFLRKRQREDAGKGAPKAGEARQAADALSVTDPEDVRPGDLRGYFQALLAPEPEKAVRELIVTDAAARVRGRAFLAHCEVVRIVKESDPARRAERLLPYYLADAGYWTGPETPRQALAACGASAAPYLLAVLNDPYQARFRADVIRMLGEIRCTEAVEPLISLLSDSNARLAKVVRESMASGADAERVRFINSRDLYAVSCAAVEALGRIDDPRARTVLEQTRQQWDAAVGSRDPIVSWCEALVARMAQPSSAPPTQPLR